VLHILLMDNRFQEIVFLLVRHRILYDGISVTFCVQVAIFLIQRNRQALLGRSIDDIEMRRIINLLIADPVRMLTFLLRFHWTFHGVSSICHGSLKLSVIHFSTGTSPCIMSGSNDCWKIFSMGISLS
jgi:hypothetical protein